ncbi:hypothetical protein [Vreelandella massiliensis]|uniref:hypothetical protein n=1 Tax=Vreelandella massiliensis TaxID=1816686 RepID=UPI001F3D3AA8|nr:hypothetical protein [Halomonas massiliensis]
MTTGVSNKPLSEKLAERRKKQLAELDDVTQQQLHEHVSVLQQQLSDVRRTTETAIRKQSEKTTSALNEFRQQHQQQIKDIEQHLAQAANQAERLSRAGSLQSWIRPLSITLSVMLTVGAITSGGLLLTDRLIDNRLDRLAILRKEIRRAEQIPRLPEGIQIRAFQGATYLLGVDPDTMWTGTINDGQTPVIRLTRE